jgi:hypothetical protein
VPLALLYQVVVVFSSQSFSAFYPFVLLQEDHHEQLEVRFVEQRELLLFVLSLVLPEAVGHVL